MGVERRDPLERRVYLHPGGIWAEAYASVITTVLGSCVSVCLWDADTALGGINHFVLPRGGAVRSAHYGGHAMPMLLESVLELGARQSSLVSCVFGGASIFPIEGKGPQLGSRNVSVALDFLDREGIAVLRSDVGGGQGRKLTFRTTDGSTLVRKM
jgi:chemotaxis protein CheD